MPCNTPQTWTLKERFEIGRDRRKALNHCHDQLSTMAAVLCGIFKVLDKMELLEKVISQFDEKESGITKKEIRGWYKYHLKVDSDRKETYSK